MDKTDDLILSRKLRNAILKHKPDESAGFKISLKNILVNGAKRGCSGFISNQDGSVHVYVNTERSCLGGTMLVRNARHDKDFTGLTNHHVQTLGDLVYRIHYLMKFPNVR